MESCFAAHRFAYLGWQIVIRLNGLNGAGFILGSAEIRSKEELEQSLSMIGDHHLGGDAISELTQAAQCISMAWRLRISGSASQLKQASATTTVKGHSELIKRHLPLGRALLLLTFTLARFDRDLPFQKSTI